VRVSDIGETTPLEGKGRMSRLDRAGRFAIPACHSVDEREGNLHFHIALVVIVRAGHIVDGQEQSPGDAVGIDASG
jgi:hypothetical protein